ncbi:MAG TPA: NTP transferase domain-containing protein [Chthonomonadaceae bacterium]|nr:NTP transferase domain-containing protein [Chthonomonadaceae bacterium]
MTALAVLLAAGAGRKFWPYNEVRNKCAFPIANVPMALRLARQLREIGFQQIVVVVGVQEGSVRAALRPLGEEGLTFVRQPAGTPGTATAALAALESAGALTPETQALVVYGDCVVGTDDLRATWQRVQEDGADAAALCAPLNGERPHDWITATPHAGNRLGGIEGHGRGGSHRMAGVYALGPAAWPFLRAHPGRTTHVPVGGMPALEAELAETVATMAEEGLNIAAVEAAQPCVDVDKPWHILEATEAVLREKAASLRESGSMIDPTASVSDGAEIEGPICVGPGATIGKRVVLRGPAWIGGGARVINGAIVGENVLIGDRSRVSDYCLVGGGSVLGRGCVVGHGGEFDGAMLDGAYIYHYSEIYGVLGEAVDIGAAGVCGTLRFDDGETIHKISGRREFPRNGANATYFGDYVRTGVNVITQPGVKIGAYSCVGPGIVVYEDVPSRKLLLLKQEIVTRDWGPERYGW